MGTFQGLCKFKGCRVKKPINPAIKKPQSIIKYTLGILYIQYYELGSYN